MEETISVQRRWTDIRAEALPAITKIFARDCGQREQAPARAGQLLDLLHAQGFRSQDIKDWLTETGIGAAWNAALDEGRPLSVAPCLTPLLTGRTADILSGSGTLTAALARTAEVDAYERAGAYPAEPAVPTKPLDTLWSVGPGVYDTALFATVLHHEPAPSTLIEKVLATLHPTRLAVVENCLSSTVSNEFHDFMDSFFNLCLNDFDVECPGEHRTVEGWLEFLGHYGDTRLVHQLPDVAGIPFPYEIFLVEVRTGSVG
ncbi:hypothetical protein [Streptomyces sp. NRRL F-2799]|uniref:hypothetical protein n=1 Tax=Streptomyces sp. NRRL F-2799 TaxID=1463844 RepID=UPI0004C97020|nr:hypothetical protein [Streptomyces sp. NRRL F-2799]